MEDAINSIQAVKVTLEEIELKATVSNLEKLLGCQQVLTGVIERLKEGNDGHDHVE